MSVEHRLTGYSRTSDAMVEQYPIPRRLLDLAKNVAHVRRDDPEAIWSYQLRHRTSAASDSDDAYWY